MKPASTAIRMAAKALHWLPRRQRGQLICVGTAKSGTHSIEAIFKETLRSAHEPDSEMIIRLIRERTKGKVVDSAVKKYLLNRDRRLRLEIDSSQLNFFILDDLLKLFPNARFLLTIRNPYAWLDSFINHQLGRNRATEAWQQLRDYRFRPDKYIHPNEEIALKERGLYSLDGYLSYWAMHNATVLRNVPPNRLLVVRTNEIGKRITDICEFANIAAGSADRDQSHSFLANKRFNVLDLVPKAHLDLKIRTHCKSLIERFFPEIAKPPHHSQDLAAPTNYGT